MSTLSEEEYGVDEDENYGVNVCVPGSNGIVIPPIDIGLPRDCVACLESVVDPLSESEQFGIDIYIDTKVPILELLQQLDDTESNF